MGIALSIDTSEYNILQKVQAIAYKTVLEQCGWDRKQAAKRLGVCDRTLKQHLKRFIELGWLTKKQ